MMTLQQLDKYTDQLELDGMVELTQVGAKATPGEAITAVCKIYRKVRPYFETYTSLFFLPKKLKAPVLTFMLFMDGLCPTE